MTDPRGVCARRAESLMPGVPYVRGWARGREGAEALAEELREVGLDADFPGLKADVNIVGDGVVCLGAIRPEAAELLARLLTAGMAEEMAQNAAAQSVSSGGSEA
ncbi:hypothetical protein [Streptomyces sp. NPDC020917]|uniref:hypothetical protein n=1 Tax=Streptomyces sp. NPDC020917 TaxID=3365102 RepID=UPI00379E197F